MMRIIKDIRVFRSNTENTDGNPLPNGVENKELNCVIRRIVMRLREERFSLGEFDHLYINFTSCPVRNGVEPSKRSVDRHHPWFRFWDAEVSKELLDSLYEKRCIQPVVEIIEQILTRFFCSPRFDAEAIRTCFSDATEQGENMLMKYKEKTSGEITATLYLRFLDCGLYEPLLRVHDADNHLLLEKKLKRTHVFDAYGEIRISKKQVVIMPRRNSFTKELNPMVFAI
jgi:hypothetical protein